MSMRRAAQQISRKTKETAIAVSVDLDGTGTSDDRDRRRLLRPYAGPAVAPFADRHDDRGQGRPAYRRSPHGRGYRHRARPGAVARRSATGAASRRYASLDLAMDETLTRAADRRVGPAVPGLERRLLRAEDRHVRHRTGARVLPGAGAECRHHAACHRTSTAPTTTISPRPASRRWRGCCARRPSIDPRQADRVPSTKGTSEGLRLHGHLCRHGAARRGRQRRRRRAVFVRDGFSWLAFLLPPLWLLWHRLWLEAALVVVAVAGADRRSARSPGLGVAGGAAVAARLASCRPGRPGSARRGAAPPRLARMAASSSADEPRRGRDPLSCRRARPSSAADAARRRRHRRPQLGRARPSQAARARPVRLSGRPLTCASRSSTTAPAICARPPRPSSAPRARPASTPRST